MNGEVLSLNAEKIVFPVKGEEQKATEIKPVEAGEVKTAPIAASEIRNRFARLKKSLRKRAVSIL